MMKSSRMFLRIATCFALLFLLSACRQPVFHEAFSALEFSVSKENIVFRVGTSFGECIGYCRTEMKVNGTTLQLKESGWNFSSMQVPDRFYTDSITVDEWNALVDAFDWRTFAALDSVIGCPDCADGGAEWLEVEYFGKVKKVTIEYGAELKGLESFLEQVRTIRERLKDRIRNGSKFPQVALTNQSADSLHRDIFTLDTVSVEQDVLIADVSHSGGCREHFYGLYMSPPAFKESFPVQADLFLAHYGNDDPCDAIIRETRKFDIRPIAEAYQNSYGRLDPIILNVHWLENDGQVKEISIEYTPE